jgi:hypothetical protein
VNERVAHNRLPEWWLRQDRTEAIGITVEVLGDRNATIFLAVQLYDASDEQIAAQLQLSPAQVREIYGQTLSKLQGPWAPQLREYLWDDRFLLIDTARAHSAVAGRGIVRTAVRGMRAATRHPTVPAATHRASAPLLLKRLSAEGLPGPSSMRCRT